MKKKKSKIGTIFYYILITMEVLILVFSIGSKLINKTPTIFGYSLNVIATGSMEPDISVGDVIICKSIDDPSTLKKNDIITYKGEVGTYANKNITHEIISIREDNGHYYFITKGTANTLEDPEISEDQLISKYICKTYVLTFIYGILTTFYGFILLIVVPIAYMIMMEIISMVKEIKEDKKNEANKKEVK